MRLASLPVTKSLDASVMSMESNEEDAEAAPLPVAFEFDFPHETISKIDIMMMRMKFPPNKSSIGHDLPNLN